MHVLSKRMSLVIEREPARDFLMYTEIAYEEQKLTPQSQRRLHGEREYYIERVEDLIHRFASVCFTRICMHVEIEISQLHINIE